MGQSFKEINKKKTDWKPSESDMVCFIHFLLEVLLKQTLFQFKIWDVKSKKRKQEDLQSSSPCLKE